MNRQAVDIKKVKQIESALRFIDSIEKEEDKYKKVQLFVNMMTYYDEVNANNFQLFCLDLLQDRSRYSIDSKLKNKIIELEDIKKSTYEKKGLENVN